MNIYQQICIKEFFPQRSNVCQEDCHKFVRHIGRLYQHANTPFDLEGIKHEKVLGILTYSVPKLLEWQDKKSKEIS